MKALVDFMYTSRISVNQSNVYELLDASNFLQILPVRDFCTKYLVAKLTVANCVSNLELSRQFFVESMTQHVIKFISLHLDQVRQTKDFLALSLEELKFILDSDDLIFAPEEGVFGAMMEWVKFDESSRAENVSKLIADLRLKLLKRKFLVKVLSREPLVRNDRSAFQTIVDFYEALLLPDDPEFGGKQKKRKVLRNEPKAEELKWTQHTLVEGGEFEIDFGEKRTIYKIDFRMASDAVEQLKKRICPRVLADPRGQQMRWPLVVQVYCPYLNAWDTFLNNFLFLHVKGPSKVLNNQINLKKPLQTRKIRIHIHDVPPKSFLIAFSVPKTDRKSDNSISEH